MLIGAVRKVCRCEPVTDVTGVAAPRLDGNSLVLRPRCLKIRGIVPEGNTLGVPHQRTRWFAMTERFLTAPITTMVSAFVAEWYGHTMQMRGDAKSRNLLHFVLNFEFRNCSLDPQHPIADSDVRLYVLLPVFSAFQLFAQGRHEHPQRSNIVFPTAAPNLLCDVGVSQNLSHIF